MGRTLFALSCLLLLFTIPAFSAQEPETIIIGNAQIPAPSDSKTPTHPIDGEIIPLETNNEPVPPEAPSQDLNLNVEEKPKDSTPAPKVEAVSDKPKEAPVENKEAPVVKPSEPTEQKPTTPAAAPEEKKENTPAPTEGQKGTTQPETVPVTPVTDNTATPKETEGEKPKENTVTEAVIAVAPEKVNHFNIRSVFSTMAIVSVVLLFALMIHYRYQLEKYRVAPFSPPKWCPESMFPKMHSSKRNEHLSQAYQMIEVGDYQPPEFY
jgi:outer membrane biosynthesis protein TonB